jgi:hypothetical protein
MRSRRADALARVSLRVCGASACVTNISVPAVAGAYANASDAGCLALANKASGALESALHEGVRVLLAPGCASLVNVTLTASWACVNHSARCSAARNEQLAVTPLAVAAAGPPAGHAAALCSAVNVTLAALDEYVAAAAAPAGGLVLGVEAELNDTSGGAALRWSPVGAPSAVAEDRVANCTAELSATGVPSAPAEWRSAVAACLATMQVCGGRAGDSLGVSLRASLRGASLPWLNSSDASAELSVSDPVALASGAPPSATSYEDEPLAVAPWLLASVASAVVNASDVRARLVLDVRASDGLALVSVLCASNESSVALQQVAPGAPQWVSPPGSALDGVARALAPAGNCTFAFGADEHGSANVTAWLELVSWTAWRSPANASLALAVLPVLDATVAIVAPAALLVEDSRANVQFNVTFDDGACVLACVRASARCS